MAAAVQIQDQVLVGAADQRLHHSIGNYTASGKVADGIFHGLFYTFRTGSRMIGVKGRSSSHGHKGSYRRQRSYIPVPSSGPRGELESFQLSTEKERYLHGSVKGHRGFGALTVRGLEA